MSDRPDDAPSVPPLLERDTHPPSGMRYPWIDARVPGVVRVVGGGERSGRLAPRRNPAQAIVIHSTGRGIIERWLALGAAERAHRSPAALALEVYRRGPTGPHYMIDQEGRITQLCSEELCAWGVGSKGAAPYVRAARDWDVVRGRNDPRYRWWRERWPEYGSPADLGGGHLWDRDPLAGGRLSCNANVIHLEVVEPIGRRAEWSPATWASLTPLVADIAARRELALERDRVLTHADAHPLARTTASGAPYDTRASGQFSWARLERELAARGIRGAQLPVG